MSFSPSPINCMWLCSKDKLKVFGHVPVMQTHTFKMSLISDTTNSLKSPATKKWSRSFSKTSPISYLLCSFSFIYFKSLSLKCPTSGSLSLHVIKLFTIDDLLSFFGNNTHYTKKTTKLLPLFVFHNSSSYACPHLLVVGSSERSSTVHCHQ